MKQEEIKGVLELHAKWRACHPEGKRADLSGADLSGADLSYADLSYANLRNAILSGANLSYANLSYADLSYANLSYANLSYANLRNAILSGANLSYANLSYADLSYANLSYANLSYADLSYANLSYANLSYAKLPAFKICPEEGDFVGWKKVKGDFVLKLLITGKRISTPIGRKCRTNECKVLAAYDRKGNEVSYDERCAFASKQDSSFTYEVGAYVLEPNLDEDIRVECTKGIHFFLTRAEAEEY
jgi:hypothetical protein